MNGRELVDRDQDDLDNHEEWEDYDEEFPYDIQEEDPIFEDLDFDPDWMEIDGRIEPEIREEAAVPLTRYE